MNSTMPTHGYLQIKDTKTSADLTSNTYRVMHIRNVAQTPVMKQLSAREQGMTRADVLDILMPLSRTPWSNVPTLIDINVRSKRP
ncbi:hypothetical protein EDD11_008655 [Mortierella claussenii]|nr:hypothetical protein EDD11_008655 [Mortierella claussenii]